ncbi:hypothetical protein [Morganella morganii]|uniref:hypothetical protein n=1 Tax=Morganella morganii TaxID=582 RepID=UPI00061EC12B|nr:hypothetical protein [Morganella morganii]KJY03399.1 hypothetical protein Mm0Y_02896 [Morganella morganii]
MNNSVNEKQISSAVIYKLMLIGLSIPMMFLSVLFGVMGMFGYGTVLINGEMITGIAALPASLLFGLNFYCYIHNYFWNDDFHRTMVLQQIQTIKNKNH